jgi:hypothetical protein
MGIYASSQIFRDMFRFLCLGCCRIVIRRYKSYRTSVPSNIQGKMEKEIKESHFLPRKPSRRRSQGSPTARAALFESRKDEINDIVLPIFNLIRLECVLARRPNLPV